MTKPTTISRKDLYERVWATPMSTLAKEFGLSDQGLAKKCHKHNIPRPPVGHWAKVAHGKRIKRPPLPEVADPKLDVVHFDSPVVASDVASPPPDPRIEQVSRIDVEAAQRRRLPIVIESRRGFANCYSNQYGHVFPRRDSTERTLDINVTKSSLSRAHGLYALLDAVVQIANGHVDINSEGKTVIRIDGEEIRISLAEGTRRVEREPSSAEAKRSWLRGTTTREYVPSGVLTLSISGHGLWGTSVRTQWRDTKRYTLEHQLPDILRSVLAAAPIMREARVEAERRQREWERVRREEAKLKHRRERLDQPLVDFERHAARVTTFARIEQSLDEGERLRLSEWFEWARSQLIDEDPLSNLGEYTELPEWMDR